METAQPTNTDKIEGIPFWLKSDPLDRLGVASEDVKRDMNEIVEEAIEQWIDPVSSPLTQEQKQAVLGLRKRLMSITAMHMVGAIRGKVEHLVHTELDRLERILDITGPKPKTALEQAADILTHRAKIRHHNDATEEFWQVANLLFDRIRMCEDESKAFALLTVMKKLDC